MYKKTTELQLPVSPEVAGFAVVMEAKLQMEGYDDLTSWEGIPMEKLLSQLKVKAERLASTDPSNVYEVFTRAVVVGNLSMMIAEKTAQLREKAEQALKEKDAAAVSSNGASPCKDVPTHTAPRRSRTVGRPVSLRSAK